MCRNCCLAHDPGRIIYFITFSYGPFFKSKTVKMKKSLLLVTCMLFAMVLLAQRNITGKVTDETGAPVANASVTIKETGTGINTNAVGTYSITLEPKAKTLVFSYVGKLSEEVTIGNQSVINATLKPDGKSLN